MKFFYKPIQLISLLIPEEEALKEGICKRLNSVSSLLCALPSKFAKVFYNSFKHDVALIIVLIMIF